MERGDERASAKGNGGGHLVKRAKGIDDAQVISMGNGIGRLENKERASGGDAEGNEKVSHSASASHRAVNMSENETGIDG